MSVSCALCGAGAPEPPVDWTSSRDLRGRQQWYCVACARENLRAIEGRLDQEWW